MISYWALPLILSHIVRSTSAHQGCNFVPPVAKDNAILQEKVTTSIRKRRRGRASPVLCTQCVTVPTYVTVFQNDSGGGSEVDQDKVDEQIAVLNERFADTPFTFNLVQTRFETDNDLYDSMEDQEEFIGDAFREGGLGDLNIYIGGVNSGSVAFFPPVQPDGDDTFFSGDGTFVAIDTVPGGESTCCNLGLTLVHEVGHWFGLHHVSL